MERRVRTVLGDIAPAHLGTTNGHEHVFQVSPLLPGDELDDPARSEREIALLRDSGFAAMIDATPIGLGRRPAELARISRATGVTIIAATGIHRDAHYREGHPLLELDVAGRAALMLRDVTAGMPPTGDEPACPPERNGAEEPGGSRTPETAIRAGILKVGLDYWRITPSERRTLEAIAPVHARTGAPVMVHLEFCTAAHEVLDLLEGMGVATGAVLLAHADRAPDAGLHTELLARGAVLGYDGVARARVRTDEELIDLTERVLAGPAGERAAGRIVLGGDVARASRYVSYGGMPGLAHLGARHLPRLRERIGGAAVQRMLVEAPRDLLARVRPADGEAPAPRTRDGGLEDPGGRAQS